MGTSDKRVKGPPTPLGDWMRGTCKKQGLSLRQVAARTNLSHGTIADIIKGAHPSPKTIRKLAECFAGKGYERLALEDKLLVLAGYRTPHPEGQNLSQPLARLMDVASRLCEPQLKLLMRFTKFVVDIDKVSTNEAGATNTYSSEDGCQQADLYQPGKQELRDYR